MIKNLAAIILFFFALLQSGCVITNTPGFYSGYKKLQPEQHALVQFMDHQLVIPNDYSKVYAITAQSLLASIQEKDSVLVYMWSAHCKSDNCVSISMAQTYCDKKNYDLYVISEYYDDLLFANLGKTRNPLLIINHKYYKTDYCPKYTKLFVKELDSDKLLDKSGNRFLLFNKGKLVRAQEYLDYNFLF